MKRIKLLLYSLCALVILYSGWNLWSIQRSTRQAAGLYQALAEQVRSTEQENAPEETGEPAEETGPANPWLAEMKAENPDLAAWLTIPNTAIDYPVMQRAEDDDFYLTHDFTGKKEPHGAPFLDVACKLGESENLVIYGHHMTDGTMFQNLMLYKDATFCRESAPIQLHTPEESREYRPLLVMLISVKEAEQFPYYRCVDLSDEEMYRAYLTRCKQYAIWSAEEMPEPGTPLLTLSTCEYSRQDGRLVVVAGEV